MKKEILEATEKVRAAVMDLDDAVNHLDELVDRAHERDLWRDCAEKLYDELRVRGVSESVSRDGAGCIEIFEALWSEYMG